VYRPCDIADEADFAGLVSRLKPLWATERELCTRSHFSSCCLESDGADETIERARDALVETVKLREFLWCNPGRGDERSQNSSGERTVDAFEEFEEDEAIPLQWGSLAPVSGGLRQ
jgi:hypothetical protein